MTSSADNPEQAISAKMNEFARMKRAFGFSVEGLIYAFKHEAAFRCELFLGCFFTPLALWLPVSAVEKALLIGVMCIILMTEIMNSAIEAIVDRVSEERHPLSKAAKDLGSAAVLIALVLFWVVWGLIAVPVLWHKVF